MCRIFGYLGTKDVGIDELKNVSRNQIEGGPDQQFLLVEDNYALGNNRLSIVGLEGGLQPYTNDEDIQIVYNGEIYNHEFLREELAVLGHTISDPCDGAILPVLYELHGEEFVKKLDGMFAIAIIKKTAQENLLQIFTDPSGMKSLYYYLDEQSNTFYFSSEIPSLLAFLDVPKKLWLPGVESYLSTKAIFGEHTMFSDIYMIPKSSILTYSVANGLTINSFDSIVGNQCTNHSLESVLENEVAQLIEADVPISTINSGGLDSSLVTSIASKQMNGLHTFNIAYTGEWPFDEKKYAKEVSDFCNTTHHQILLDPNEFSVMIPTVTQKLGQPNADPITLSSYALFKNIKEAGFKVAISGDGADEIFGGYERYERLMSAEQVDWDAYLNSLSAIDSEMREYVFSDEYKQLNRHVSTPDTIKNQINQETGSDLSKVLKFEQKYRLPNYHLRRVDHLSMANSVEVRVPFCQQSIIKFANDLEDDKKIKNGEVKRELYAVAQGKLPQSVLTRKKQPFTLPINQMMFDGSPLMNFVEDKLDFKVMSEQNIFNATYVSSMIKNQKHNPSDKTALALWSLMIFQVWLEEFQIEVPDLKKLCEEKELVNS